MKKKTIKFLKLLLKYLLPVVIGWLEGDSHTVANALSDLLVLYKF